ncbi:MAG: adenosylcobinamide-phosphate synthase CbiB [Phormidesmis sp.]
MREAGRRLKAKAQALWCKGGLEGSFEAIWLQGAILLAAAGLDFGLGDPWSWPHPVQAMGKVISAYSKLILRLPLARWAMRMGGVGLGCLLIGGSALLSGYGLWALGLISPWLQTGVAVVLLASCFAGRSLRLAAEGVLEPLAKENLPQARSRLAMIVGRDTEQLTAEEIRRAVLETVSENAIDGALAPLFYAVMGAWLGWAVPLAIAYKAASTLDSMVGYREAPYTDLGWFSARVEDGLTWLPCRLSVVTIALLSGRPRRVLHQCWRDARADPSPNAGWSECAYAAALGVQLGGPNIYRGQLKVKPLLGEANRPITDEVIKAAFGLTRLSFLVGLTVGAVGLAVIGLC